MTIMTTKARRDAIPLALEKLEELRKLAAEIDGEVVYDMPLRDKPERPVIMIDSGFVRVELLVSFPLPSDTPLSAGQEEGTQQ
jgi:hypothetical protein